MEIVVRLVELITSRLGECITQEVIVLVYLPKASGSASGISEYSKKKCNSI